MGGDIEFCKGRGCNMKLDCHRFTHPHRQGHNSHGELDKQTSKVLCFLSNAGKPRSRAALRLAAKAAKGG